MKRKREYTKETKMTLLEQYKKLLGVQRGGADSLEGVSWGISDEKEVYDSHSDYNLPLDTSKLLTLQGMTDKQRHKVQVYQEKNRQLERLEGRKGEQTQYDQMAGEAYQAEEALRMSLFGNNPDINLDRIRSIQNEDTFNQDEFYDRTQQATA